MDGKMALLCCSLFLLAGRSAGQAAEEVAAVVNGEQITRTQLVEALLERVGPGLLEELVREALVRQALAQKKITLDPQVVNDRMEEFKKQFDSEEQFQTWLTQRGVTLVGLRKQVELDLGVEELVRSTIHISDADIRREHERIHKQVRARRLAVLTEAEARELRRRIQGGADFAELAREYSIDEGTRRRGGDLGSVSYESLHPTFAEALFRLKEGELSEPIQTPGGYNLILVESIKPAPPLDKRTEDELRERFIQEQLAEKKEAWLREMLAQAEIERIMFR